MLLLRYRCSGSRIPPIPSTRVPPSDGERKVLGVNRAASPRRDTGPRRDETSLRPHAGLYLRRRSARALRQPRARCASTRDRLFANPQTGVAPGVTRSRNMRSRCRCSMCPAIHINSRSWLRSSSTHEPSDPPLRVIYLFFVSTVSSGQRSGGQSRRTRSPLLFVNSA